MRIVHRLVISKEWSNDFAKFGINLKEHEDTVTASAGAVVVTLDEAHQKWPQIQVLLGQTDSLDQIDTKFSPAELSAAPFVCFKSKSFSGFPEPSDDFGYLAVTYDLKDYCETCGVGERQNAPFRMIREVQWGRRKTTQMNWLHGEIFVPPKIWEDVFKPFGIACNPVLNKRGNHELQSVVQVVIDQTSHFEMPKALTTETCPTCGRLKYNPFNRAFWPLPSATEAKIFRSFEYFGSGGESYRYMFASSDLYRKMVEHGLNCRFWPCGFPDPALTNTNS